MENLNGALFLLSVGMIMVFTVLWLVVGLGNLIINLTNRYAPDDESAPNNKKGESRNSKKLAAIVAAVDVVTNSEGVAETIRKK